MVPGVDPADSIVENADLIVTARVADLLRWDRKIGDPRNVAELHQMRIAAKRLRYTMELFEPFYGRGFGAAVDRIKGFQEQLGAIHDADVLVPRLAEQARKLLRPRGRAAAEGVFVADFDAASGLLALCRRLADGRRATHRRFLADWRKARASGFFEALPGIARRDEPAGSEPGKESERHGKGKPPVEAVSSDGA